MATRGSYVLNSMVELLGGIPIILVLCNFLRKFMVSDIKSHMAFRTQHNSSNLRPIREILNFHYLPKVNSTLALSLD